MNYFPSAYDPWHSHYMDHLSNLNQIIYYLDHAFVFVMRVLRQVYNNLYCFEKKLSRYENITRPLHTKYIIRIYQRYYLVSIFLKTVII